MAGAESERLAALYDLDNDAPRGAGGPGTLDVEWFRALAHRVGGPVLELGCGTGRVAVPIAADGCRVVGVDRSAAMLDRGRSRARSAGARVDYRQEDMRHFELGERFRLVLIPFNTFLLLEPDERAPCLSRVLRHLGVDGRLAIDVFQPDAHTVAGAEGVVVEEWTRDDPDTGRSIAKFVSSRATVDRTTLSFRYDEVAADGTVRRHGRSTTLHHLYRREAQLLFSAAGFAIESIHGDYEGSPADEDASRLLIVARPVPRRTRGKGDGHER